MPNAFSPLTAENQYPPGWFPGADGHANIPGNTPFYNPAQVFSPSTTWVQLTAGSNLFYSSTAVQTTVTLDLGSQLAVNSVTGFPVLYPYTLLLEWGTANQEVVTITSAPVTTGPGPFTFYGVQRAQDGTALVAHAPGAQVNHGVSARDYGQIQPVFNVCAYGADQSGAQDATGACQAAINACGAAGGGIVYFPAGNFACTGTLVVNYDNVTLLGSGRNKASALSYIPGTTRTAAIIVGGTRIVQNSNVDSLFIDASPNFNQQAPQTGSGHGIVFRSNGGCINNTIVQFVNGDCFHLALDNLLAQPVWDVTMTNCYGQFSTSNGLYIDTNFNDCEYTVCKFDGYQVTGNTGILCMGGQQTFISCHAYGWASNGVTVGNGGNPTVQGAHFIGGEYETNTGTGIVLNGVLNSSIIGVTFYANTVQDIYLVASYTTVADCSFTGSNIAVGAAMLIDGGVGVVVADNIINNPLYTWGIYLQGGSTSCQIHDNYINSNTADAGVALDSSTYCDVHSNVAAGLIEVGTANFNRFFGNIIPNGVAPFIILLGASSVQYMNTGPNASSTLVPQLSNYAATAPVTVTAATITSIGSITIPAAEPITGSVYKLTAHGTLSTAATAGTATVDMRWGGTAGTLLTSILTGTNTVALTASLTTQPIMIEGQIEFVTGTGTSSATVVGWLRMTWRNSNTATTAPIVALASITTAVTISTAANTVFSLDWTCSVATDTLLISASNFERVA